MKCVKLRVSVRRGIDGERTLSILHKGFILYLNEEIIMKLEEFKSIMHLLPKDIDIHINPSDNPTGVLTAKWRLWGGWKSNHDQRIEGATCTNCRWEHPTVHQSLDNLGKFCSQCGAAIIDVETF